MNNLNKIILKNSQLIRGGIDLILLEEEFDLWKSSLKEEHIKQIFTQHNGAADALIIYYKKFVLNCK